jgi:hypothetical protein
MARLKLSAPLGRGAASNFSDRQFSMRMTCDAVLAVLTSRECSLPAISRERLDPSNGLCLSSLHDAAFDSGLITLDENLTVVLSKRLKSHFPQFTLEQNFVPFEGKRIELPQKLAEPNPEFLCYHREERFMG